MKNKRIERILIPVDYSPNAKRATDYGVSLAKMIDAEVILFHSYHPTVLLAEDVTILDHIRKDENDKMEKLIEEIKGDYGELVRLKGIVEFGAAVDWIQSIVDKENIDLIVMGTKGEANKFDALIGSVASHVINDVQCSALVIPENVNKFEITEVLFATDYHQTDKTSYHQSLIHLMKVFDPNIDIVNFQHNIDKLEINQIEELKLNHIFNDFKHSFHFIEGDDVEQGIFSFVEANHCDLIVILTKHYNLWQRIYHKSIAKKLALHTKVPLLVLHEDD